MYRQILDYLYQVIGLSPCMRGAGLNLSINLIGISLMGVRL